MIEYHSKYGIIKGVINETYYDNGQLKECQIREHNQILTNVGAFVPRYEIFETRTKFRNALSFYESGALKSIYLENQEEVMTSVGILKVELITFYEDGNIHRVFPRYGQISGYWSEEEELALVETASVKLESVHVNCKISCYYFYPTGQVKSLSLWKNEKILVQINNESIWVHLGISFYENGKIKSLEPFEPAKVITEIGTFYAYDNKPLGIHGDNNSLCFSMDGKVKSFITSLNAIVISGEGMEETTISPTLIPSEMDVEEMEIASIKIEIEENKVIITDVYQVVHTYDIEKYNFSCFAPHIDGESLCGGNCSNCSQCHQ